MAALLKFTFLNFILPCYELEGITNCVISVNFQIFIMTTVSIQLGHIRLKVIKNRNSYVRRKGKGKDDLK